MPVGGTNKDGEPPLSNSIVLEISPVVSVCFGNLLPVLRVGGGIMLQLPKNLPQQTLK
jgi:hypothetical protein